MGMGPLCQRWNWSDERPSILVWPVLYECSEGWNPGPSRVQENHSLLREPLSWPSSKAVHHETWGISSWISWSHVHHSDPWPWVTSIWEEAIEKSLNTCRAAPGWHTKGCRKPNEHYSTLKHCHLAIFGSHGITVRPKKIMQWMKMACMKIWMKWFGSAVTGSCILRSLIISWIFPGRGTPSLTSSASSASSVAVVQQVYDFTAPPFLSDSLLEEMPRSDAAKPGAATFIGSPRYTSKIIQELDAHPLSSTMKKTESFNSRNQSPGCSIQESARKLQLPRTGRRVHVRLSEQCWSSQLVSGNYR